MDAGPGPRALGRPVAIASYLGKGEKFDRAIGDFAEAYADQNESDFKEFGGDCRRGGSTAVTGL